MSTAPSGEPGDPTTRTSRLFRRAEVNNVPLKTILATVAVLVLVYVAA